MTTNDQVVNRKACFLGGADISHQSPHSPDKKTVVATAVDEQTRSSATPQLRKDIPTHQKRWGGRTFRFSLMSFRLGKGVSLRRFSIVEAALLLMMAYIASRGLGVVRQTIFNALFGTGLEANAYYAAARLPDTLFNLIAGGALSHAFVPVFLTCEKDHDQREAWRLTSLVFNVLLVMLTASLLLGEFLTPVLVNTLLVPGYSASQQTLITDLTRIMLVQPLILGLGTIATAVLNSKRQFLLPALSIAVYNFGLIGGLLFTLAFPKIGIYGPTYGILAAATLQVAVMIPGLLKQGLRYTFTWDLRHPGLIEVMRLLIPNALAVGVGSLGPVLDTNFASYFSDLASLAALHNAQMLYALPLALLSQAIGQAALPQWSVQAAFGRYVRLRQTAMKVIGASILLSLPCALLLYVLGKPTIHILFQHGAFTAHSSALTNMALIGYAVGIPGLTAGDMLARGFIALKDARTPLFTNLFALVARFGFIVLLLQVFTGSLVILAIPLATSISATLEAVLLCLVLLLRVNAKVRTDKGMQRLLQRRKHSLSLKKKPKQLVPEQEG
jgi:putative peptidoglycan lipid II flippase